MNNKAGKQISYLFEAKYKTFNDYINFHFCIFYIRVFLYKILKFHP